jgi:hypothetical protein
MAAGLDVGRRERKMLLTTVSARRGLRSRRNRAGIAALEYFRTSTTPRLRRKTRLAALPGPGNTSKWVGIVRAAALLSYEGPGNRTGYAVALSRTVGAKRIA